MKKEIGMFYAYSFRGKKIRFVVYDDKTIDCPILNLRDYNQLYIRPRFRMFSIDGRRYMFNALGSNEENKSDLIGRYDIDKKLFNYLKRNNMIKYSNDMAYLYGFSDTKGFDSKKEHCGVGSPYKWAKKKGPILTRQKKGQFN